jgi:hypothetical protein
LEWHAASLQYRCGMLLQPMHYLPFIPQFLEPHAARYLGGIVIPMVRRWIAADTNCDSTAEL